MKSQQEKILRIITELPADERKRLEELAKIDKEEFAIAIAELLRVSTVIESGNTLLWEEIKRTWERELAQIH